MIENKILENKFIEKLKKRKREVGMRRKGSATYKYL